MSPTSSLPIPGGYDADDDKGGALKTAKKLMDKGGAMKAAMVCWAPNGIFGPYVYALFAVWIVYSALGGSLRKCTTAELIGYSSTLAEGLGLLSIRYKIHTRNSVAGISGNSIAMFTLTYTVRLWQMWPRSTQRLLDDAAVEMLSLLSLLMVLDTARCVFSTYRHTYQEEIDHLQVKHLVPWCFLAALLVHPCFRRGFFYSYFWTLGFYLDVVSLLPQVVMMAKGGGRIEAPVAHFVAATTLSRSIDLEWWFTRGLNLGPQGYIWGVNYSGFLIVSMHVFGLLLAADFMYYYIKARFAGKGLSDDLVLPDNDVC